MPSIAHTTRYDDQGRVIESRTPAATGTDAGTTLTTYYAADGTAPCGGRPEWADLTCQTRPGGPITDAGTNPIELTNMDKDMEAQFRSLTPDLNHVLVLDLEPAMNQQNYKDIKMSN